MGCTSISANFYLFEGLGKNSHLHHLDAQDAQDLRVQELLEDRRRYLLEDRPGLSLVTEALYTE